jgi:hypothetical protein
VEPLSTDDLARPGRWVSQRLEALVRVLEVIPGKDHNKDGGIVIGHGRPAGTVAAGNEEGNGRRLSRR